jgi:hypothetical protein
VDVEFPFNRVSREMADCFDIDSTMTVMETKSGGKSTGENRKVRIYVLLLLLKDISR